MVRGESKVCILVCWPIAQYSAQWEFGRPTLTPTNLEDKTEVKVD